MAAREEVNTILAELGAEAGLGALTLEADEQLALELDGFALVLGLVEAPVPVLLCTIRIAEIAADDHEMANLVLAAGYATWMRGIMTLGLAPDGISVQGVGMVPVSGLRAEVLKAQLAAMAESAATVALAIERRDRIDPGPSGDAGEDVPMPPASMQFV